MTVTRNPHPPARRDRRTDLILATLLAMVKPRRRRKRHVRPRGPAPKPLALVVNNRRPRQEAAPETSREQQLVLAHLGMVRLIARGYARRLPASVDRAELESAGTLGLIDAARRFDPTRGATFKTFAAYRVRGAIVDQMRGHESVYTRGEHRRVEAGLQDGPTVAFNSALVDDYEGTTDTEGVDPFLVSRVRRALTQLPRRERQLIVWRFWHGALQTDCCPRLRIGPCRVSQIEARALGHLRALLADVGPAADAG